MAKRTQPAKNDPLAYVKAHLKKVGPKGWPAIEAKTGKPVSLMRKIAYGDRKNPRLDTLMPLVRHFERQDARKAA